MRTLSLSDPYSEGSRDNSYRPRSSTPPDECFSYKEDNLHERMALGRTGSRPSRVMSVARTLAEDSRFEPKRIKMNILPILGFSKEDKIRTIQPYDDALVVTLRIEGYDVKRVMVDQGNGVDIIYLDLFKGLNLKLEDLTSYDSPLISFEGKAVIPKGQIRLPV
ncbi:uncharacterized protein LOC142606276 [Castanea sativa]|uniref:uncharacterized protein LOC142606276 n=1 Tax=Castanea sativa TaxID=21020 RepID=UPI003F64CA50